MTNVHKQLLEEALKGLADIHAPKDKYNYNIEYNKLKFEGGTQTVEHKLGIYLGINSKTMNRVFAHSWIGSVYDEYEVWEQATKKILMYGMQNIINNG